MSGVLFLFPGQGSQSVGMTRLLSGHEAAQRVFTAAAAAVPFDLVSVCEQGPPELLTRTDVAQPAIFATSLATWAALCALSGWSGDNLGQAAAVRDLAKVGPGAGHVFMGHSLGDYGALVASGCLGFEEALQVVVRRGQAMQAAGEAGKGGMTAVIGAADAMVEEVCGRFEGVWPANYNTPDQQLVVSGLKDALAPFEAAVVAAGARKAIRLPVSGAFHSPLMASASEAVAEAFRGIAPSSAVDTGCFFSSTEVDFVRVGDVPRAMTRQVVSAVKFSQSVEMVRAEVELVIEVGPGRVLSGLVKRIAPELTVISTEREEGMLQAAEVLEGLRARGGRP